MERVIVVSKNQKASEFFEKFLIAHKIRDITHASSGAKARRAFGEQDYDLAIVISPLPEETGEALAKELALRPETQVIFIAKEEILLSGESELLKCGVIMQSIPITRAGTDQCFKLAYAFSNKMKKLIVQTKTLQTKLQEIKKIDLAKCYIIEMDNICEEEAHKIIEKLAMNKRKTKLQIANEIIDKYRSKNEKS
ncbi:MAG: ANTAR domain-containing protein [Bacillota bacterium]